MTRPTLSLDSSEYRALILANLARAHDFVSQNTQITAEHVASFSTYIDRMKVMAQAWHFAAPQVEPKPEAPKPAAEAQAVAPQTNGAHEPKKPGWPKGKSRKKSAPEASVQ